MYMIYTYIYINISINPATKYINTHTCTDSLHVRNISIYVSAQTKDACLNVMCCVCMYVCVCVCVCLCVAIFVGMSAHACTCGVFRYIVVQVHSAVVAVM
jgi:hypothetical protein